MYDNCIYLFALSFTVQKESGIALVSAANSRDAFSILKRSGRYNGLPDSYVLSEYVKIGIYSENRYELLIEMYTNALIAYRVIKDAIERFYTSDELIATLGYIPANVEALDTKVDKVEGMGLSEANYTAEEKRQLADLVANGTGAIREIQRNGVALEIVDKTVNILVPEALADLSADSTHRLVSDAEKSAWNAKYEKPSTGIPASDLADGVIPDVSNFITKSVNDLVNYYLKSETYTKSEVEALIGAIQQFHYEIYASTSAVTNPQGNVLYLIGPTGSGSDRYEEYVYTNNTWTKIGDTSIDLSDYVTTTALNTALANYTTTANLTTLLAGKQDVIDDLATIRSGAAAGATAYQKPNTGIPASDLAAGVIPTVPTDVVKYSSQSLTDAQKTQARTNIGAGTYSKPSGGIPKTDLASGVQGSLDLADSAVQATPVGQVTPEVNPYDYATRAELNQLGQKSYSFAFNGGVSNVGSWDGGGQYYKISDFIPIVGGEVIYGYSTTSRCVVQFYDANKTWISSLNPVGGAMNLVTLTPDIVPANAVYFRAGTLTAYEAQSYIHQPCINALDKFVPFVPTIERTTAQAQKVDGIIFSEDYTATNVQLNLAVVLPVPSAYVMVKIDTPPSSTFSIGRRANYTSTVYTYLTGCAYNTWIKVEQSDDLKILYIFNTETSAAATIPVTVLYKTLEDSVEQRLDMMEAASVRGKKIVVFGDSLSEFDHDGKTWPMHFAEITGAEMINCAIGGTQIKQRGPLVTLFNESTTYNVGDRVYYKPSTTMKCYNCIAQHTGAWSDSDFEEVQYYVYAYSTLDMVNLIGAVCDVDTPIESRFVNVDAAAECVKDNAGDNNLAIIERLKAIDWSTVDAVILMGGRNDYGGTNPGTSGSTDKNTTLGAINEIVRIFLSTHKNISFYYITPTVNWFNYSGGVGADADWCDVYVALGASLTYGAFVKLLQTEFEKNHIPVCDLYGTLGWNKWNFSNFFTANDGSHPLLGLRQMAVRIAAWLSSSKVA